MSRSVSAHLLVQVVVVLDGGRRHGSQDRVSKRSWGKVREFAQVEHVLMLRGHEHGRPLIEVLVTLPIMPAFVLWQQ